MAVSGCSIIVLVMAWYVWFQCRLQHSTKTKIYPTGVKVENGIPLEPLRLHAVVVVAEDHCDTSATFK